MLLSIRGFLRQLRRFVPRGARVLDVGCAESVLSHVLLYMGYEVWGFGHQ